VTAAELRRFCLAQPDAREEFPFGPETSVFKVAGKMFALSPLQRKPLTVSVKCEPELGEQLRGTYDEIEPGYHLNKRHWLTVTCGGAAPDELVRELVAGSYELVAPQ
jgi:predicted DNA-binding protein (MmcQ/YjbR family)